MKRSDMIKHLKDSVYNDIIGMILSDCEADGILKCLEKAGMKPSKYVNPLAKEDPRIDWSKGEIFAYVSYIDAYPDTGSEPYQFYLDGWEKEDE